MRSRRRGRLGGGDRERGTRTAAEQHEQVRFQPEFRFSMESVSPLLCVEASIVIGSKQMMKILMINNRLDEEARYGR